MRLLTRSRTLPACWPDWVCARSVPRSTAVQHSMEVQSSEPAAHVRPCSDWRQPPASLVLNWDDVHVWRIPLAVSPRVVADLASFLSPEENTRAGRILHEEAGRRFVVSHGATRRILGRYLDERPEEIRFVTGRRGKPHLVTSAGAPAVRFSLSHSGEVALCAVTEGRDIGVDIERIRPVLAWRQIAARYFSTCENQILCSLPDDQAREAFFQGWTRKEACAKASGEGITQRWTQFTVSLERRAGPEVRNAALGAWADAPFTLCPLAPGSGHVAAVAAQGSGWRLSCWQWSWADFPLRGS